MLFIHDHRFILFHLTNKFSRRRKIYKRSFVSYELNQNAMAETGFNAYEVLGLPADSDEGSRCVTRGNSIGYKSKARYGTVPVLY